MDYTQNYQLNQWEATDRVLREDFNSDNAKIDAAIAAAAARPSRTLLKDEPMEGDYQFSLQTDLTDIDWNQWQAVCMDIWTLNSQGGTAEVLINGGGYHTAMGGSRADGFATGRISAIESESHNPRPIRIYFLPMGDERNLVRAISMNDEIFFYSYIGMPFSQAETLSVVTTGSAFRPGSRIAVWGLR